MKQKFASIELARLYEAQGYLEDALSMYRALDPDGSEGGAEVRAGVKRLESALANAGTRPSSGGLPLKDPAQQILDTLEELNPESQRETGMPAFDRGDREIKMAVLMEKWLALMVVRKRLKLFKRIRARV